MEVSPSLLEFRGTFTKQSTEYLKLTNTAKSPLAFKVKTTAPKLYCVRPNASVVQPGESIDISIILQGFSQPLPSDYKCKDKFLLVSLPCPELTDASKVGDIWSELEAKYKSQVVSKKLRVSYVITDSDEDTTNGAADVSHNGNGYHDGDVSHINQTVINEASTAQATPVKSNGAPYGAAGAASAAAVASSGLSRNDPVAAARSPQTPAVPRASPPSPPVAPAPPVPQQHAEKHQEKSAPVHSQPAALEQANGISPQLAAILVIIAFLLGWLVF